MDSASEAEEIGFDRMLSRLGLFLALACPGADGTLVDPQLDPALGVAHGTRRALLVGIDDYPAENHWPALSGPKRDVAALRAVLLEHAGFRAADVHTLVDGQATAHAIASACEAMVDASARGDLVLFYFAGHGSQLPDDSKDELDGMDETLVPYDATAGRGQWRDIRDDELGRWIRRANEKTDQVVLIFDCCSSGTNTRADSTRVRRYLEPAARGLDRARSSARAATPVEVGSGYAPPASKYVALSACRADESAFEIQVDAHQAPGEKLARGLFSYYLVEALATIEPGASYADLMAHVISRVSREQEGQTPIFEGPLAGYSLFEPVAAARSQRFVLSVDKTGTPTLSAGRLHGFLAGAVFSVCDETALHDSSAERLGRVRIVQSGATESQVEWIEAGDAARAPGARSAFLLERGTTDARLPFAVDGGDDAAATHEIAQAIESTHVLRRADPGDALLTLALRDGRVVVHDSTGQALPLAADIGTPKDIVALTNDLARLAAAYRTDQLLRQSIANELAIDADLERLDAGGAVAGPIPVDPRGRREVARDEPWAFSIRNRSSVPVYAVLLAILPDGEVALFEPPTRDDLLQPEQALVKRLTIGIPAGLDAFYRAHPVTLYCIATPRFLDLSCLEQGPVTCGKRSRSGGESSTRDPLACEAWSAQRVEVWVSPDAPPVK